MKEIFFLIFYVYYAASSSPPEISFNPTNVRIGTRVTIRCRPNQDSLVDLTNIYLFSPNSLLPIISIGRVNNEDQWRLALKESGIDATFSIENNVPVLTVNFPSTSKEDAGIYNCKLRYTVSAYSEATAQLNLVVWEAPGIPSAVTLEPSDVNEGSQFNATCRGDVGYPFGNLELVSSSAHQKGFVEISRGCGSTAPTCFRYDSQPYLMDARTATYTWVIREANELANGMEFWCRALHQYSPEKRLSSVSSSLRVLYSPRDMQLLTSTGARFSPTGRTRTLSDIQFELKAKDSAWVECSAKGNPPPGVLWRLAPNQSLNASAYRLDGSRLVLKDALLLAATSARFVCEASNSINGKTSTNNLTVTFKITVVKEAEEPPVANLKADVISSTPKSDSARAGQMAVETTPGGGSAVGTVVVVAILVVLVLVAAVFVVVVVYIFVCRKQSSNQNEAPVSGARNGRNGSANGKSKPVEQPLLSEKPREVGLVAESESSENARRHDQYSQPMVAPGAAPVQKPTHQGMASFPPLPDQKNDMDSSL